MSSAFNIIKITLNNATKRPTLPRFYFKSAISIKFSFADDYVALRPEREHIFVNYCSDRRYASPFLTRFYQFYLLGVLNCKGKLFEFDAEP